MPDYDKLNMKLKHFPLALKPQKDIINKQRDLKSVPMIKNDYKSNSIILINNYDHKIKTYLVIPLNL